MPNENIVVFGGHLGKDAETKYTQQGTQYTKFSMCSTKKWKQGDEWKEKQVWINVLAWKNDYAINLKKGDGVVIVGELDYNVWTDKKDVKHYDVSIVANSIHLTQKIEKKQPEKTGPNPEIDESDSLPF